MTARLGVCLAGPTAAGKSDVAFALAAEWPVEIVSVDSAQVYRGMDIGTAKPSADERAAVAHHLIDIVDPADAYSAAAFAADASRLAGEIRARGRVPLLVGGTMLYFKALRDGLSTLPPADAGVRRAIDDRAAADGWPALHAELARVDAATARRLAPNDAQRIQRALEVWQVSGRPLSAWQRDAATVSTDAAAWPLVSLEPLDRRWLHARIAARTERMLAAGLVDEVRRLRARGDLTPALPSMRCVGYRQTWQSLDGTASAPLAQTIAAATRQLAKRQTTWLRGWPTRDVVAADAPTAIGDAVRALRRHATCF